MQQEIGIPFMYALQAESFLTSGLRCQINPIITMFVTPESRRLMPSQASSSHLLQKTVVLGMAGVTHQAISPKEIVAVLVEEVKGIVKSDEVSGSAQLITLGLDSFGFVSSKRSPD